VIVPVRGNVQTRLSKAGPGGLLDAVVLALAGLRRLGLEQHVTEVLPLDLSLPAGGQGALAIETVRGSAAEKACAPLEDAETARCVRAERALLARLSGSCIVPIAAFAVTEADGSLRLRAALGGPVDGKVKVLHAEGSGREPEALGTAVAEDLLRKGAGPLLEASRSQAAGLSAPSGGASFAGDGRSPKGGA
jgi:hydroxymethylbilane synthase